MKRVTVSMVVFGIALVIFSIAFAQEKTPDATLKLEQGQVAVGIGWSWGKGVLTYKGKDYPFKVEGLSVGDIGVTKAEAVGKVYYLKKRSDFNGTYSSAAAEGTVGGGAGISSMKNQNGVLVVLTSMTQGLNFKLAAQGVKFTLEKTQK